MDLIRIRSSVTTATTSQVAKINDSMKNRAALWTGIAAGAGFLLGLAGRVAHIRAQRRRTTPDVVIIEAHC